MPRTMRAETRVALLCAILGANVDPAFHVWNFRLADVLAVVVAMLAPYIAVWVVVEGARAVGRSVPWVRRGCLEPRTA